MSKRKAAVIDRESLREREPKVLSWRDKIDLSPKSDPEIFAGTHRLAIGRVVGGDSSRPFLQGYLVCEKGTFYFLPSGDASSPVYRVPPNSTCMLPTADQAIQIRAFSKEDLRGGTSYDVSRIRLQIDRTASADTRFVCVVQKIPDGTASAKAPLLTKRRVLIGGLVAAALAGSGALLTQCSQASAAEPRTPELRLEE